MQGITPRNPENVEFVGIRIMLDMKLFYVKFSSVNKTLFCLNMALTEQYDICKLAFEGNTGILKHKIKENPELATSRDEVIYASNCFP